MRLPLDTSARAVPNAVARLVNVQAERNPPDAKGPARVMRAPGVRALRSGHGLGRGLHAMGGVVFSVEGNGLYRDGEWVGTIPGSSPVRMADNGTTLVIAADGLGYAYAPEFTRITDADFVGATTFDFIDGHFVFIEPDSGRFWVTNLYSTDVADALMYATAEAAPDKLVDLIVDHREVILFGHTSVERWWNAGGEDFPLERSPQGVSEIGCLGGVAKLDNSVFWVGNDRTVRRLTGSTPLRVSTHPVEERIAAATGTPRGFSYSLDGHLVYVCAWDDLTLCFDATTGSWFERQSYDDEPWRVCAAVNVAGTVYVQDRASGAVGILDPDVRTEWDEVIVAQWTYPSIFTQGRRMFHVKLELICEMGAGAEVMLEFSDDGGKTWTFAPSRSLGLTGVYRNRAMWFRLGSAHDRVYRMSVSDPVAVNVSDTLIEVA